MSALPAIAEVPARSRHVREVPNSDIRGPRLCVAHSQGLHHGGPRARPGAAESPLWVNLRRTQREHMPSGSPADNRHQRALSAAAAPAILPMEAQTPVTRAPPAPKEAP